MSQVRTVFAEGLWVNNPGLIQLLGLCPLLAVTTTLAYGLGLGAATLIVLILSNALVSLTRKVTVSHLRIPMYVLIIAGIVTGVEMAMQAWFFELHRVLGLFVPLIVTNCLIITRAEIFASRQSVGLSIVDGIAHGLGFALVLAMMGFIRELLGNGTLFAHMDTVFGAGAQSMTIELNQGMLFFVLPPGAFLVLGFLIAGYRAVHLSRTLPTDVSSRQDAAVVTPDEHPVAGADVHT